jgi:hypothetical protein
MTSIFRHIYNFVRAVTYIPRAFMWTMTILHRGYDLRTINTVLHSAEIQREIDEHLAANRSRHEALPLILEKHFPVRNRND